MEIRVVGAAEMGQLAALIWRFAGPEERTGTERAFAEELLRWWEAQRDSHVPFLAVPPSGRAVGMAWLAVSARVPRPGQAGRLCGDIQSVYVVPEHRSAGVGTALVRAVLRHAEALGLEHVTVHSNERAASLYERAGFGASQDLLMRTLR
jgi:GNAT superfamily N-acetyltransferase